MLSAQLQEILGAVITALLSLFDVRDPRVVQILSQDQNLLVSLPPQWQWPWWPDRLPLGWVHVAAQALLAFVLFLLILELRQININRFSMHGTYRNRLVRAFLGTTRQQRRADWFTGFDEDDNPKLSALRARGGKGQKLFPVINLALNRSSGGPTGRAERMAASYTATPLHCGSEELAEAVESAPAPSTSSGSSYIATADFAYLDSRSEYASGTQRPVYERGISLGSVITASGAAASPHAGYHTNPLTAFIMTLFNVRLGLWLPNHAALCATDPRLSQNRPPNAITALLNDLIGRTTLESKAIYLSDGGHFDNLGLYEMLRRRCKHIVVIDAGADPDCEFADLGMAIRKAEIDLPVLVTMGEMRIMSRKQIEKQAEKGNGRPASAGADAALGVAIGKIRYLPPTATTTGLTSADAAIETWREAEQHGVLIYIKPSLLADIPAAARAYAREHEDFPHETTADQFFSESQFESYRVLGWWQTNWLTGGARDFPSLDAFFAAAQRRVANSTAERRART